MINEYKLVFLFLIFFSFNASAKVKSLNVNEISSYSDVIVIAEIISVNRNFIGKKIAKARVIEVLKGEVQNKFEFGASPSWACDISHAVSGESVLLFLNKEEGKNKYTITHSGRGYMPIRVVENKKYIVVPLDIKVPENIPKIKSAETEDFSKESIELEYVTRQLHP